MTALEVLKGAREWLGDPAHWTKFSYAKQIGQRWEIMPAASNKDKIRCTCLKGALMLHARYPRAQEVYDAEDVIYSCINYPTVFWNDLPERTHSEVLAALDCAIDKAAING